MSQPPKSTMRAPTATWASASGVRLREADMDRLRCGGIARVTEYAGLEAESARASWIFRPSVLLPESRSEEHTSELQSLMRISYAVFCLKKKNRQNPDTDHY